jgi:4-amino-4-deoxy-L-arabinose transferase-like glycosyltransferase
MAAGTPPESASSKQASAVAVILSVGAAIRLVQYLASSSLWIDELFIALNVTRHGWGDLLFESLDYNQVAPIGFLALEKLATSLFGHTEVALRLFPTLFSLASLVLFWRVARRFLEDRPLLVALVLFAINPIVLWTARNAKQYSGDIMVTLLLLLLALRFREGRKDLRSAVVAGIVGGVAILASQPAVLVAGGLVVLLAFDRIRKNVPLRPTIALCSTLAIGAIIVAVTSLLLSPDSTRRFMRAGWKVAFVAPPWRDPYSLPRLMFRYVAYFFGGMIPNTLPEIVLVGSMMGFLIIGAWWLARRRPSASTLLAIPLVVAIFASAAHLLPFSGRVSAYVGPTLIVALSGGIAALQERFSRRMKTVGVAAALCLFAVPALSQLLLIPPIYRREDTRPVLEEVQARWQAGDVLYSLHGGRRAMEFYGEQMGLFPWVAGQDHGFARRAYLREVDSLRGRPRVWFFFTHAKRCEPETVLSYLNVIGTQIERIEDRDDNRGKREAAAYLYDLSDPGHLARSTAASHPVPSSAKDCERAPVSQAEIIKREFREFLSRWIP